MKILLAQINPTVGDIVNNSMMMQHWSKHFADKLSLGLDDLIVFPEMSLCGYLPMDLLYNDKLIHDIEDAVAYLVDNISSPILFGAPYKDMDGSLYNQAVLISPKSDSVRRISKSILPNNDVFDECRYFKAVKQNTTKDSKLDTAEDVSQVLKSIDVMICEDIWHDIALDKMITNESKGIICINASPFNIGKFDDRLYRLSQVAKTTNKWIGYINLFGGQDELVFDGCSMVVDSKGNLLDKALAFSKSAILIDIPDSDLESGQIETHILDVPENLDSLPKYTFNYLDYPKNIIEDESDNALIYKAICLAIRDFIHKNGIKKALVGLSGGIDSALTLVLAAHAIGSENVKAHIMPYVYTRDISIVDAKLLVSRLGILSKIIPINQSVGIIENILSGFAEDANKDNKKLYMQNLQARIRGVILMAMSNLEANSMVLSTSNKSESAVGYTTIYGDMVGGFSPIKDLYKTQVFSLSKWINDTFGEIIPTRIIERAPSAELDENQFDEDSLPAYELLDKILYLFIEESKSSEDIILKGYDKDVVKKVALLIKNSEYKRFQSPPGVKINKRSLTKLEWRIPLSNRYI